MARLCGLPDDNVTHGKGFQMLGKMGDRMLKPGDVVEVRSAKEILTTLDHNASLDAMPEALKEADRKVNPDPRHL